MRDDDPRHGTTAGHAAGCRLICCREARNTDERRRRKHRQVLGIVRAVPATGTQRRIRALMAIGWTSEEIRRRAGWGTPQAVTELLTTRTTVYRHTAATIADVYAELCMTPGPSAKNRREAMKKGWAPPLAWEDIDNDAAPVGVGYTRKRTGNQHAEDKIDPVVVMRLLEGDRVPSTHAERQEAMARWVADGGSRRELASWHGWKPERYTAGLRVVQGGAA